MSTTKSQVATERYGKRLLPQIIDERAKANYSRPFALFPRSPDCSDGFRSINYAELANAVNRMSWWLDETFPLPEKKETPFAYFGPNDLRYIVFFLAAMKTGRKILLASPRNSVEAQLTLFERSKCRIIVSCSSLGHSLDAIFNASVEIRKVEAPNLDEVLADLHVPHYSFDDTFESLSDDAILFVHTSGSSGNPKPIGWNKNCIGGFDTNFLSEERERSLTRECFQRQYVLSLLPCFHSGGFAISKYVAYFEMVLVLGHPQTPISASHTAQMLKHGVITTLLTAPSILEDLSKDPESLRDLSRLEHVLYGGGPLQPAVGKKLATLLPHLGSYIGATECGWFHNVMGDNKTWDSLRFFSDVGYRFDEVSDGVFELLIERNDHTNRFQPVFQVFPHLQQYRTNDLYSINPDFPGWMRYRGRSDDLIALSNGEKVDPIPMENIIRNHPLIKAALVIGEYRFRPSLLVEMESGSVPETEIERHECLKNIWPTIQAANKAAPGFSKLSKSLIRFATVDKPFLRAGKGTVQCQLTVKSYLEELDFLYSSQETSLLIEGLSLDTSCSPESIKILVREIYSQTLESSDLKDEDDVFQYGIDSLRVLTVVQRLQAALKACGATFNFAAIDARLIYSAPSIMKLADAIVLLASKDNGIALSTEDTEFRQNRMRSMLEEYSSNIPSILTPKRRQETQPWHVILTGTTGSLGGYLLDRLQALPTYVVAKIFCLNRSADAKQRQKKSSITRGSTIDLEDERIEFIKVELSQPELGLDRITYARLLSETTVIIHNAWQVDFNLSIDSFAPQVRGVRNLLDLAIQSTNKPPVIFTSSISATLGWMEKHPGDVVPETVIRDFSAPEKLGYAESKYVSELLLEEFSKKAGLTTAIFRIGQIAGPVSSKGVWSKREWFPSVVASSKHLDVLPETLGSMENIEWIPVDTLSTIIIELVEKVLQSQSHGEMFVYNLVNPKAIAWSSLSKKVQTEARISRVISLRDWVKALEESRHERNGAIVETNPAVKLIDFFRLLSSIEQQKGGISGYETERLVRDSKEASRMEAVTPEWMRLWMRQWTL